MKYINAILLFLLPTFLMRFIYKLFQYKRIRISKGCRIGFSVIISDKIELTNKSRIGHLNFIKCNKILIQGGGIDNLNFIRGEFSVIMKRNSLIHNQNKISSIGRKYHEVYLLLEKGSRIGVKHTLDMTDCISFGINSRLAGTETQIWTHSFLYSNNGDHLIRLDAPVIIGNNCYIGTRCTILSGVELTNNCTVGACTCVTKSLNKSGLYISQNLNFREYNPNEKMEKYTKPAADGFIFRKNI